MCRTSCVLHELFECSTGASFINLYKLTSSETALKCLLRELCKWTMTTMKHLPFKNTSTCKKQSTINWDFKCFSRLDSLRSKLEQSVDAFIKARKELGEILSAEGSNEQGRLLAGASADLRTELRRHGELSARINGTLSHQESSLKENKEPKHHGRGTVKMGSSYEFLKSIMG